MEVYGDEGFELHTESRCTRKHSLSSLLGLRDDASSQRPSVISGEMWHALRFVSQRRLPSRRASSTPCLAARSSSSSASGVPERDAKVVVGAQRRNTEVVVQRHLERVAQEEDRLLVPPL